MPCASSSFGSQTEALPGVGTGGVGFVGDVGCSDVGDSCHNCNY